jgi:hypothetical protein
MLAVKVSIDEILSKTLFGRIVLIMIGGLILAQVLSTAIFSRASTLRPARRGRHVGIRIGKRRSDRLPPTNEALPTDHPVPILPCR